MGHHAKNLSSETKRRFVLADKLAPKADHEVMKSESFAFGGPTPIERKTNVVTSNEPSDELQDSIKAILAKFE